MAVRVAVDVKVSLGVGVSDRVGVVLGVNVGVLVAEGVGVLEEPGLIETPPMAQWSLLPSEALKVTCGLAPSRLAPAPIVFPPPAARSHRSTPGDEKLTEVHVSQEKTPSTI